ncbi:MAG: phage holin family protein [Deltaproteobacteria bacterium]|nr:phage holin family protein [Deltaproteobacteria bacterium]
MSSALGYLTDLTATASDLLHDGFALIETRMQLLSLELQEEKSRVVGLLVWAASAVFFGILAVAMVTFTVIYLLEGEGRVVAMVLFTLFYLLAAAVSAVVIRKKLLSTKPFARTLEALKKDRECF